MKYKFGTVLLSVSIIALIITSASYILIGKQTGSEDVYSTRTKEKTTKMVKSPVPIWEKVIKLLIRL